MVCFSKNESRSFRNKFFDNPESGDRQYRLPPPGDVISRCYLSDGINRSSRASREWAERRNWVSLDKHAALRWNAYERMARRRVIAIILKCSPQQLVPCIAARARRGMIIITLFIADCADWRPRLCSPQTAHGAPSPPIDLTLPSRVLVINTQLS